MPIKWKIFSKSFPYVCNKCGDVSNSKREFCEVCGTAGNYRDITKEDYAKYLENSS